MQVHRHDYQVANNRMLSKYLSNVMKICAKINIMQNINITFCSFTVLNKLKAHSKNLTAWAEAT